MTEEPNIVKARKLAALAERGATEHERSNAAEMLRRHLQRCGLTWLDLTDTATFKCSLAAVANPKQPKKDLQFVTLAAQLARFIAGRSDVQMNASPASIAIPATGKKKPRIAKYFILTAELTRAEGADWKECFLHYAPMLARALKELRAKEREAKAAVKAALAGLVNAHHLFPPDAPKAKAAREASDKFALWAAMRAARGDSWERKAGHLDQMNLLEC